MKGTLRFVLLSSGGAVGGVLIGMALGWLSGEPSSQMQGPIAMGTAGLLAGLAVDLQARIPDDEGQRLSEMALGLLITAILGCGVVGTFMDLGPEGGRPLGACMWVLGGATGAAFLALVYDLRIRKRD
jgi:hypothetical protein